MKNIYKFLVLILITGISACNDSDEAAESVDGLSVVESSVSFPAKGGSGGYIKVNLTEDYTATSNQSWCTLSPDKDVIKVSATVNPQLESRAALVTISYGNKKEEVAVYQHGEQFSIEKTELIFDLKNGPNDPQRISITTNAALTVTVADPWITANIVGDSLVVYCNSASTEERNTTITVSAEVSTAVITVVQKEFIFYEDYLGEWTLTGTDIYTGEEITYPNIVISQNVHNESYYVTGWYSWDIFADMRFVMNYDQTTQEVSINVSLQEAIGSVEDYVVYFLAAIYVPGVGVDYLYNEVAGLKGKLKQNKVNWEYQTAYDLFYGEDFEVLGMSYMLPELSYWDDYILYNAVLTKK